MKLRCSMVIKSLALGMCFCCIAVGCASFPGKELPKYTYEQIVPHAPKPSIDYDAKFLTFGNANAQAVKTFQEEVDKVFTKSSFFNKFGAGIGSEKYHFSMVLKNEGNMGLAVVSGFISGFTMTIIPGYARDEYTLTVDVTKEGKLLKQYQYKHYMDTIIQLFMIFLTPTHSPAEVGRKVMDDMLLNFLHDLEKDQILNAL
jgi:hypothetical protein